MNRKISSALISVFHKDGLSPIIEALQSNQIKMYSTGGTQKFIEEQGAEVTPVENLTDYPSIFGGRVKTLHPKVFGGILYRREEENDVNEAGQYSIPSIDLVIVDLYPFEDTVASGGSHEEIIEKIDIGGISLIRGAAKNYRDVLIISSKDQYKELLKILTEQQGETTLEERSRFAAAAFAKSSHYDTAIFNYMNRDVELPDFRMSHESRTALRYGENPHQQGSFCGEFDKYFDQLAGKELSYNNLLDVDAAVQLMADFDESQPTFAILKHNNACGIARAQTLVAAYNRAFEADTLSAFGGILIANKKIDLATAEAMHDLFFEILIAPGFDDDARALLTEKKKRILLLQKQKWDEKRQVKSVLNGLLVQDYDRKTDKETDLKVVTKQKPRQSEIASLLFAATVCKHSKSNTIVLAKDDQLLASGVGQTSRVDALKQAIAKAQSFNLNLEGAGMASDAFFPFPDCVEIAKKAGIASVIQPGGSVKDQLSIDYCDENGMSMVFTGTRHFKH